MNIFHPARPSADGRLPPRSRCASGKSVWGVGRAAISVLVAAAAVHGQAWSAQPTTGAVVPQQLSAAASNAELMYLVLVGEMQVAAKQAGVGFSLILDAAKKSGDADLFRRAVNVALESRSAEAAKEAARAWTVSLPSSQDAYRVLLQLMLATNDVAQSAEPLKQLLAVVPDTERSAVIDAVAQTYARANDKDAARRVALAAMQPWTAKADTAASAWAATGMLWLAAGLTDAAAEAMTSALTSRAQTDAPGFLAVALLNAKASGAEGMLQKALERNPSLPVRMAYVRHLLDNERATDAQRQLELATQQDANAPEPWLLLGALNLQANRPPLAEKDFLRYLELSAGQDTERAERGKTQAYLSLSQIAESRKDFDAATRWLDRIDADDDALRVQLRRATLLGRKGQVSEARALIGQIPERQPTDRRAKLAAEVQILKDAQQLPQAFALLQGAVQKDPDDADLAYDLAMLADKMGNHAEMERLLRQLMARKPDYHHAFNALGYSLAERNTRLNEAKDLILKALAMAPGDPFITDSLGWVEYRLGNLAEAARLLREAYAKRADVEISLHLGEVLWVMGEREAARQAFGQARDMQADSATLQEVLQRLGVQL
jgi:tetratricopeptide (TPR) repeat protein